MRGLACLAVVLVLASCSTALQSEKVLPLATRIVDRHDVYVAADEGALDRDAWLAESAGVLTSLRASPVVAPRRLKPGLDRVCARHDAYVEADPSPDAEQRRATWLRSSAILRRMVDEAAAR